jgi:hypothetical protein
MSDTSTPSWYGTGAGRGPGGQFLHGNQIGVGSSGPKSAKRAAALRRSLLDATSEDDLKKAWATLTTLAHGGDVVALKLYLAYVIGAPAQVLEVSGPDNEGVKLDLGQIAAVVLQVATAEGTAGERRALAATLIKQIGHSTEGEPDATGD